MKGRDVLEISLIAQEQAERKPLSGLRMFQSAINHGGFDEEESEDYGDLKGLCSPHWSLPYPSRTEEPST